jgi:hypothetical protein
VVISTKSLFLKKRSISDKKLFSKATMLLRRVMSCGMFITFSTSKNKLTLLKTFGKVRDQGE